MPKCEDYPCCGHGPSPLGDGGGCPRIDSEGREIYRCVLCGIELKPNVSSSICSKCHDKGLSDFYSDPDRVEFGD